MDMTRPIAENLTQTQTETRHAELRLVTYSNHGTNESQPRNESSDRDVQIDILDLDLNNYDFEKLLSSGYGVNL